MSTKKTPPDSLKPKIDAEWPALYQAIGEAIAAWAGLEHALASAFALTLNIKDGLADPIFFSARAFNGKRDMLMAAIKYAKLPQKHVVRQKIFKSGCNAASRWYPVRNKLAHELPTVSTVDDEMLGGTLIPNVPTDDFQSHVERTLTTKAIKESAENFSLLGKLIYEAGELSGGTLLEKLLQQVRELPDRPYSDSLDIHPVILARSRQQ
ncbi:hypothetical protein [Shumkonia mesophila]|uniref:hypothetical protein n=1 Tax=Shumkonia mesophila TaxID=2838854 RepID=UPI00293414E6|nr:hypothetical protein [Shumkonia mesophila]